MVLSASSLHGVSWLEASGAVAAENQVLRLFADLAGMPQGAGGCFVSGGSAGNLSALVVARDTGRRRLGLTATAPVCGALLYREPHLARAVRTQDASYLDAIHGADGADHDADRNPSDYAYHLTRRPRGLPLWFSLAVHGTDAYRDAVARGAEIARYTARLVEATDSLDLLREPELTVVLIRRTGWGPEDYYAWSKRLLASGLAFVTPSVWEGETVARLAFLHPGITEETVRAIITSLADEPGHGPGAPGRP
ncbi:pyridoxal-dependent decarboxylase-like protein [Streptomyces sp. PanSC19]|uniref:pyridoxal-dependent decarboxylase n=1 Tax=Streptomyces sp. PanSC19 TaxID=1520455 RepID=UPI000F91D0B8|nr:pyridoxal-dependent decarboxylase [Streptomyces sp. PanSC19]ROQ26620.1 pyridoxal-dependent decarboxylase-like protein [Streptomyces sp. PanSC19]